MFALASCSDKNKSDEPTLPIEGLEMPSATTPIVAGAPVTIKGSGFTATSEIWLNAITKADEGVKATVTAFTATSISFTVPTSISGEQNITLRQDGKEFTLGKLTFEIADAKLYCIYSAEDYRDGMILRQIDRQSGKATDVTTYEGYIGAIVPIGQTLYHWAQFSNTANDGVTTTTSELGSFDLTSKTHKTLAKDIKLMGALIAVNNKLNILCIDTATYDVSLHEVNTTSGEFTKISDFGSVKSLIGDNEKMYINSLVYSEKENCIVSTLNVYSETTQDEYQMLGSIDLASKKMTTSAKLSATEDCVLFNKGAEIGVAKEITHNYDTDNETYSTKIYTLDARTLALGTTELGSFEGSSYHWVYDVKTDVMYGYDYREGVFAFDFKTGAAPKMINTSKYVDAVFLVR